MSSVEGPVPPPSTLGILERGDDEDIKQAKERLQAKKRRSGLFTALRSHSPDVHRPHTSHRRKDREQNRPELLTVTSDVHTIHLQAVASSEERPEKDIYRWAILYENQRGITLFQTPYYSRMTLLPTDPLGFTTPESASQPRAHQPAVSLQEYPLPDGTWAWVSSAWLIDMRSGTGEVNYDGFEYNWAFRKGGWRSEVGKMSAGGWVRRRRWIRLMMRPTKQKPYRLDATPTTSPRDSPNPGANNRLSTGTSLPPSIFPPSMSRTPDDMFEVAAEVWRGEDPDEDWSRCHDLMKRVVRDGRKLELWKMWLATRLKDGPSKGHPGMGHHAPPPVHDSSRDRDPTRDTYGMDKWKPLESPHVNEFIENRSEVWKGKRKQWTEDSQLLPSEVVVYDLKAAAEQRARDDDIDSIKAVLRLHGNVLLDSFIYPDSRAQFLALLGRAELLPELNVGLADEVDFWSYASDLGGALGGAVLTAPNSCAGSIVASRSTTPTHTLRGRYATNGSSRTKDDRIRTEAQVMIENIVQSNAQHNAPHEHDRIEEEGEAKGTVLHEETYKGEIKMTS